MKIKNRHNQIFLAGLLAILLTLTGLLPVQAEEVRTAETTGSYQEGYVTLPFSQTWSGSAPDSSVQYTLTPIKFAEGSYISDTPAYAESGRIKYAFGSIEDETSTGLNRQTTLSGNASGQITFQWDQPGEYVFRLQCSQAGTSNYTYSGTVYRIRLYVRSTEQSAFITAQVVGNENGEANGKVSALTFAHSYTAPVTPGGGDNPTPASDGGSNSTSNNTVAQVTESGSTGTILDDIIQFITEYGSAGGDAISIEESGSHQNAYTGDDSNMILYGIIVILAIMSLTVWIIQRKRA